VAALQGSYHRQCFCLSQQQVRVQLHFADSLKNEHCACSLEFLSVFPGTINLYMQTHLSARLQETSDFLRKLWQIFLVCLLESSGKIMRRRVKEEIAADFKV